MLEKKIQRCTGNRDILVVVVFGRFSFSKEDTSMISKNMLIQSAQVSSKDVLHSRNILNKICLSSQKSPSVQIPIQETCNSFSNIQPLWDIMILGVARCFSQDDWILFWWLIADKVYFHYNIYLLLANIDEDKRGFSSTHSGTS